MTAVWMRARNELRARRRAWLAIALMIGIAGGVVMAAAAGARRSDAAVGRFLAYSRAATANVEADPSQFHAIAALPGVESASADAFMLMGKSAQATVGSRFSVNVIAFTDPTLITRPILVAGRLFNLSDPTEAMINETALRTGAFRIGETVPLQGFTFDQLQEVLRGSNALPKGPSATVRIVGVLRVPTDLSTSSPPPGVLYTGNNVLAITPALYRTVGAQTANFSGLAVRLVRGEASLPAFTEEVVKLTAGRGAVHGGSDDLQAGIEAQRATHTEALALWLFAGLAGLAAFLVVGQSLSRQVFLGSDDHAALLAIGMTRGQLVMSGLIQSFAVGLAGAVISIGTAVLLSPLAPLGLARRADIDVGFHFDLPVVLIGATACIVAMMARALLPAFSASRSTLGGRSPSGRRSRTADSFARAGMPSTSVTGVQMALDPGRGRSAVPVRTAIAGTVVATAVLIAALAFGASLTRLADTPRLQGWTWDFAVGNPHSDDVSARAIPLLRSDAFVGSFSSTAFASLRLERGYPVTALGMDPIGLIQPPMLEGRAPNGPDEIALGTKALRTVNKHVGDTVRVLHQDGKHSRQMRIVGRAVITPIIVNGQSTLGDGAVMQLSTLKSLVSPDSGEGLVNVFLIKLAAGADPTSARASLEAQFPGTVLTNYAPSEVENLRQVDSLPYVLAGLLGLLAAATIAHALVTSVRRRGRELAILKTLGFVRGQVRATVAWQASTLALLAAVIGLVGGVIGGRWVWIFFAGRLGVRPEPAIPLLLLIVILPGALVLANLIAAIPARAAARTEPALVLRTE
jgi:putative ABC transport system permease protein